MAARDDTHRLTGKGLIAQSSAHHGLERGGHRDSDATFERHRAQNCVAHERGARLPELVFRDVGATHAERGREIGGNISAAGSLQPAVCLAQQNQVRVDQRRALEAGFDDVEIGAAGGIEEHNSQPGGAPGARSAIHDDRFIEWCGILRSRTAIAG
jgi:hypothetical protein